jgi:hypothetical protein
MKNENASLTALRNALALRKKKKAVLARLARNKAEAMEAIYGFTASIPLSILASEAEKALALQKG